MAFAGLMGRRGASWGMALLSASLVTACGHSTPGATQVVAKVNSGEITVHQLNAALRQVPNVTPDTAKTAAGPVLERLIEQELLVQKAEAAKLDHNPEVLQALEAARRQVLASAWLQQSVADIPKPTEAEVKDYYTQHPEYFSGRRIFEYRSIAVQASPAVVKDVQAQLAATHSADAVIDYLRTNNVHYVVNPLIKGTEQLPVGLVPKFMSLKDGDVIALPFQEGVEIVQLIHSHPEPVGEAQGRPFIEKYLLEQRRQARAAEEIKALRSAATIQYVGEVHAPTAAATPPPKPTSPNDVTQGIAAGIK
jgi:EpsD family peptidyl-prolyl cis-trans isomerase